MTPFYTRVPYFSSVSSAATVVVYTNDLPKGPDKQWGEYRIWLLAAMPKMSCIGSAPLSVDDSIQTVIFHRRLLMHHLQQAVSERFPFFTVFSQNKF